MNTSAPIIRDNTQQPPKGPGSIWLKVLVACNLLLLISVLVIGNMLLSTRRSLDYTDSWLSDVSYQLDEAACRIEDQDYVCDTYEDPLAGQLSELGDRADAMADIIDELVDFAHSHN